MKFPLDDDSVIYGCQEHGGNIVTSSSPVNNTPRSSKIGLHLNGTLLTLQSWLHCVRMKKHPSKGYLSSII